MRLKTLVILMVALLTVSCAALNKPRLEIQDSWVKEAKVSDISLEDLNKSCICDVKPGTLTTNAFMKIKNSGSQDDRLIGAESDKVARIEFRRSSMSGELGNLSPVEDIVIPARGEIYFAPGSFTMLVMGIKEDFKSGDLLNLTLIFEKSGRLDIVVEIQPADYQP